MGFRVSGFGGIRKQDLGFRGLEYEVQGFRV